MAHSVLTQTHPVIPDQDAAWFVRPSTRLSEAAKDQDQLEDGQRKLDNG